MQLGMEIAREAKLQKGTWTLGSDMVAFPPTGRNSLVVRVAHRLSRAAIDSALQRRLLA